MGYQNFCDLTQRVGTGDVVFLELFVNPAPEQIMHCFPEAVLGFMLQTGQVHSVFCDAHRPADVLVTYRTSELDRQALIMDTAPKQTMNCYLTLW